MRRTNIIRVSKQTTTNQYIFIHIFFQKPLSTKLPSYTLTTTLLKLLCEQQRYITNISNTTTTCDKKKMMKKNEMAHTRLRARITNTYTLAFSKKLMKGKQNMIILKPKFTF